MAHYLCNYNIVSRGKGASAVSKAAYRSGEELHDERLDRTFDYTNKADIVHTNILTPIHAPEWAHDRERLWNEVERSETRKNSRLARENVLGLQRELDLDTNIEMVETFVQEHYVNRGMLADIGIHNSVASDGGDNLHAHAMLTTREITENGFTDKNRDWNNKQHVIEWRAAWAEHVNGYFEREGLDVRVDHRSYEERGIDKVPQERMGVKDTHKERQGVITEAGDRKREVAAYNIIQELHKASEQEFIHQDIEDLSIRAQMREWIGTRIERAQEWWQERVGRWQEGRTQEYER